MARWLDVWEFRWLVVERLYGTGVLERWIGDRDSQTPERLNI